MSQEETRGNEMIPTKEQFKEWYIKNRHILIPIEEFIMLDQIYSFFSSHNDRVVEEKKCSKCDRISTIVELDKSCPFCEPIKSAVKADWENKISSAVVEFWKDEDIKNFFLIGAITPSLSLAITAKITRTLRSFTESQLLLAQKELLEAVLEKKQLGDNK